MKIFIIICVLAICPRMHGAEFRITEKALLAAFDKFGFDKVGEVRPEDEYYIGWTIYELSKRDPYLYLAIRYMKCPDLTTAKDVFDRDGVITNGLLFGMNEIGDETAFGSNSVLVRTGSVVFRVEVNVPGDNGKFAKEMAIKIEKLINSGS